MSAGYDQDLKLRIKEANPIEDLVESYTPLRRQGAMLVARCPWHDDQRPSLQVHPGRQTWKCWVCDIHGDVFDFVMRREAVDFVEALKILAERAGIPLHLNSARVEKGSPNDKQTLYAAMAWAEQQYHRCLMESDEATLARDYLRDRNISTESMETFRVGFAPEKWSWLIDRSRSTEFSLPVLEACDLVVRSDRSGSWHDRFRGRIIFPIRDTLHRPIAIGGRILPAIQNQEQRPVGKYINSRETRLYSKSDNLYGLNVIRDEVAKAKNRRLTLVEGYTDVIAAWQTGLRNVAAVQGTALNERHIRLIKRFADEITLVLDGDNAGQTRTNEMLDLFVTHDIDLRILSLPEDVDPFDFLMDNGSQRFQEMIDSAPDAIEHKIRVETTGIDLARETHRANQALNRILQTLARQPISIASGSAANILRQDQILARLARKFHLEREQLKNRLIELRSKQKSNKPAIAQSPNPTEDEIDLGKLDRREAELIQSILIEPDLVDMAVENVQPGQFGEGPLRELYDAIIECFHEGTEVSINQLMLRITSPRLKSLVVYLHGEALEKEAILKTESEMFTDRHQQLESTIRVFQAQVFESGHQSVISKLEQESLDELEEMSELERLLNETRQHKGISPPKDG